MTEAPIYIHAGAHRTGTSSFQMCLYENRAALDAAGLDVSYPGRDGVPLGQLALRLPGPRHGWRKQAHFKEKLGATLRDASPDPSRGLILSDENIPGRMMHFRKGQFYPAADARADALAGGLPGVVRHLIFVVRSYDDLYISGYRKRAEDNAVAPFSESVPSRMRMDRGWPEIVEILRERLQPQALTVVSYEARGRSVDLLARLVPDLQAAELVEPDRTMNLSATDAALEHLQARYHAGETLSRAKWQAVLRDYADQREDRGVARFTPADAAQLQDRYAQDLERLAGMAGITLIR